MPPSPSLVFDSETGSKQQDGRDIKRGGEPLNFLLATVKENLESVRV